MLLKASMHKKSLVFSPDEGICLSLFQSTDHKYLCIFNGWLVWVNGPLRQYFSLYRAVSQRERKRSEKIEESKNEKKKKRLHLLQA